MNLHSNRLSCLWTALGCIGHPRMACFAFLARVKNAGSRCDDHFARGSKQGPKEGHYPVVAHTDYEDDALERYFTAKSTSWVNWVVLCGFLVDSQADDQRCACFASRNSKFDPNVGKS
jgi:hypothetical protein